MNAHLYGDQKQTYTNHALIHLPAQQRIHGAPLVLMSNFVFEGFIATIKRQYHGSRGYIQQMIRNIGKLQNVKLLKHYIPEGSQLQPIVKHLLREKTTSRKEVGSDMYLLGKIMDEAPTVPNFQTPNEIQEYFESKNTIYASRLNSGNQVYHSLCYNRRGNSNSYMVAWRDFMAQKICFKYL